MASPRVSSGRPRRDEVDERARQLVECAANLFVEKGYHRVSLEAIAREARVAVRTIYVKFGGKAGLFDAVLREHRDVFFTNMPAMDLQGRGLDDVLREFARRYLALITSERAIALQRIVITEGQNTPELSRNFWEAGPEPTLAMLSDFFARTEVRERLRADIPAQRLARHLITCLMGDHLCRLLSATPASRVEASDAHIEDALTLFLDGCRRRQA